MCIVDECINKVVAREMCANHYRRWQRHGSPTGGQRDREKLLTQDKHLYWIWAGIVKRCTCPYSKDYRQYGARGISMHPDWLNSFNRFYEYIGNKPFDGASIDRIDNDLGYVPGNIRWADSKTQARNRRSRSKKEV